MVDNKNFTNITLKAVSYLVLSIFIAAVLYPIITMFLISVKSPENFFVNPLGFPDSFHFNNYVEVWKKANVARLLINSVTVTCGTILLTMFTSSIAALAITKFNFAGKKFFFYYFVLGIIIPVQVLMVSLMKVSRFLHLQNTLVLQILLFTVFSIPLAVFLYNGFFKSIPTSILDAATIDGASFIHVLFHIVLPLSSTINVIVAILVGMNPWKDFLIPLLFSSDETTRTLSLGIMHFQTSFFTNWPYVFALMVIQTLPIFILFLLFQKYFVKGIVQGSIKL